MELKIRGVSPDTVTKIDRLAKEKGFKSRNEYLKYHLENLSIIDTLKESESKYTILTNKVLKVLEYNTIALNKFLNENLLDLEEIVKEENNI
ncbi:hypothetical protein [Cetobacterium sp.]|uniref:hypothetical protein n=1 Tax=Cetobacterium sp. TaxID=2071632 RepID=UPI002FC5A183